ncbi:hypothetical protein EKO04_006542 [Ascochyta lentis]|uniref:Uncharacterized protein n=1 Tax=Ascochyta lentis TaxID=205686 RepID=A0A8H7J336_9PLEO|nr:hypothetical protein EKO04_006542 [Ascochyta lentis]
MVATRRSGVNTASASNDPPKATKRRKIINLGTAKKLKKGATVESFVSRNPSLSTNSTAPSKHSSELYGLSTTSTPTDRVPDGCSSTTSDAVLHKKATVSTEQVIVALQKLITPGTSHNPIVVTGDSPPPNIQATTTHSTEVHPHRFYDRHSRLYTYKSSRPVLAPRPASGSTFTGHQGHDMYRMQTAKMTRPTWHLERPSNDHRNLPFEVQYPMSAQYLVPQHAFGNPRPHIQHYTPHPPAYRQPPTEEQLRNKAAQHVREYSRLSTDKRKLAEDPHDTNESESDENALNTMRSTHKSGPAQSGTELNERTSIILPDPYFQLPPLIEHASLLTSLLRVYPQSADQKGLREDIAMLASVQNQHLADWMNFEVGQNRKQLDLHTPCVSRSITSSPVKPLAPRFVTQERVEREKRRKRDDEIRNLFSADAKLWQDGSGLGVADVYAVTRASTPTATHDESKTNVATAIVSAFSPVRCTAKAPSPLPEQRTAFAPPAVEAARSKTSSMPSEGNVSGRSHMEKLVTPSPRVARTIPSPAVRTSGRKRRAPTRFRNDNIP